MAKDAVGGPSIVLSQDLINAEQLQAALGAAARSKVKLPMSQMAMHAKHSVQKNFDVGGRPKKWKPLTNRTGKPLVWRGMAGGLQGSIRARVIGGKNFKISSTDIPGKVEAHDRGAAARKITAKNAARLAWPVHGVWRRAKSVNWPGHPARPFMHLQADDANKMAEMVAKAALRHVTRQLDIKGIL